MSHRNGASGLTGMDEHNRLILLLDQRRFDEAMVRGRILLESAEACIQVRARTHNLLCWIFIEGLKQAAPEAVLHGEEAVSLAEEVHDRQLLAEAMCNLASAWYQLSDYPSARTAYSRLVTLLQEEASLLPCGLIIAYQGLAQLDQVEGRYMEAKGLLQQAEELAQADGSPSLLAEIRRRQALLLLRLNQPEQAAQALTTIDEAAFSDSPRSLWWKTHFGFTRVRVELAMGHWSSSRQAALNTLALARELGDLPVMAETACLLALIDRAEGRKEASRRARSAMAYAIHSGRRDVVEEVRERLRESLAFDA